MIRPASINSIIIDEINTMNWSYTDLAILSGITTTELQEFLIRMEELEDCKNSLTKQDAKILKLIFNKKEKYWFNIDSNYKEQFKKPEIKLDKDNTIEPKTKMGNNNRSTGKRKSFIK